MKRIATTPTHLWSNRQRVELDGKTYTATLIHQAAIEFIRQNHERPFFAFLPVTIPHAAMQAPASYVAPFQKKFAQFENKFGRYAGTETQNPIAAFAGMMTLVDEQVGEVLELIDELGIAENTVVMLRQRQRPSPGRRVTTLIFLTATVRCEATNAISMRAECGRRSSFAGRAP